VIRKTIRPVKLTIPLIAVTAIAALQPIWNNTAVAAPSRPNSRCASGTQADLSDAVTSYVGANQGWGRKKDLIDEQGSATPWNAWEPGYSDPVTVKISWSPAIRVDRVLIARNVFGPSAGIVDVVLGNGATASADLGTTTGQWLPKEMAAADQTSLQITRNAANENITEIVLCVAPGSPPTTPTTTPPPTTSPPDNNGLPQVDGVVGSLGTASPPASLKLSATYRRTQGLTGDGVVTSLSDVERFNPLSSECSPQIHGKYWVVGPNNNVYNTWHPVKDLVTQCVFGHEHGENPTVFSGTSTTNPMWKRSGGLPFGYVTEQIPNAPRHEDHVGHKVTSVEYEAALGESQNGSNRANRDTEFSTEEVFATGIRCQFLSKIHMGTHSKDAFANNMHEYFVNVSCSKNGQTSIDFSVKELAEFGNPNKFESSCFISGDRINPLWVTAKESAQVTRPPHGDWAGNLDTPTGSREIQCESQFNQQWELWVPGGRMVVPGGGSIDFGSYYAVFDPIRVHIGEGHPGSPNFKTYDATVRVAKDACADAVPRARALFQRTLARTCTVAAYANGTDRGISFKHFAVNNPTPSVTFYTDPYGITASTTATATEMIPQYAAKGAVSWLNADANGRYIGGSIDGASRDGAGRYWANGQGADHSLKVPSRELVHSPN
jgi:hypothetical protein